MKLDEIGPFEIADWALRSELPRVLSAVLREDAAAEIRATAIVDAESATRAADSLRALYERLSESLVEARPDVTRLHAILQARSAVAMATATLVRAVRLDAGDEVGGIDAVRDAARALADLALPPGVEKRATPVTSRRDEGQKAG